MIKCDGTAICFHIFFLHHPPALWSGCSPSVTYFRSLPGSVEVYAPMTCDVQPEVPDASLTTTYIPPAVAKAHFSKGWHPYFDDEAGFLPSLHTTSLDGSFTILRWHGACSANCMSQSANHFYMKARELIYMEMSRPMQPSPSLSTAMSLPHPQLPSCPTLCSRLSPIFPAPTTPSFLPCTCRRTILSPILLPLIRLSLHNSAQKCYISTFTYTHVPQARRTRQVYPMSHGPLRRSGGKLTQSLQRLATRHELP